MDENFIKSLNLKKIGAISLVITAFFITYYSLNIYKTYLEIKELKKIDDE